MTDPEPKPLEAAVPAAPERLPRAARREKAVADALRALLRDLHAERFGGGGSGEAVDLTLRLKAVPREAWALYFDPPLTEQAAAQLEDAQAAVGVYRPGRIHCFRCGSADCEHALPDSPRAVFAGYDSAGRPAWREFAQVLLERKDARVDRLFSARGEMLALFQTGRELRGDQLASFGRSSKTYAVLAQVAAGYAPLDEGETRERVAVTFQAVEARDVGGFVLHLNAVARLPGDLSVEDRLAGGWAPHLYRARVIAARDLERVAARARGAREAAHNAGFRRALAAVPGVMRRLAEFIERGERQAERRTRHVEARRQERRPVHKALDEARAAPPERVLFDEKTQAFIILGDQGRAHAFSPEGRHVTSFVLRPAAVDFRLRTRRWRPTDSAESAPFLAHFRTPPGGNARDSSPPS